MLGKIFANLGLAGRNKQESKSLECVWLGGLEDGWVYVSVRAGGGGVRRTPGREGEEKRK